MSQVEMRGVSFSYGAAPLFQDLSLRLTAGKVTSLIGANGSGKSTLLRLLARLLRPGSGSIFLDGRDVAEIPARQLAQKLSILPQNPEAPEDLRVGELVLLGRFPHRRPWGGATRRDRDVVAHSLERCGLSALADRTLGTLSGGQRQLAWIAMALAQETGTILLDEPTASLDAAHALEVLDLLQSLSVKEAHTVVLALHEINLAARYSDELIAIARDGVILKGPPREVLTAETMREVFGVDAEVLQDPRTGTPVVLSYRPKNP